MQGYNLIAVFSRDMSKMLMCRRLKEPYLGLMNFVGGKIEQARTVMKPHTVSFLRKPQLQKTISTFII